MVFSLSKRTSFAMCLQSRAFARLNVHWFGRTLLCPGIEACPACAFVRPKSYWYTAATIDRKVEIVEMCDSLAMSLQEFAASLQRPQFRGIVARGQRSSKRSTWTLKELTLHEELSREVGDAVMIDAISRLYQLPLGTPTEDLKAWFERVKTFHLPLLKQSVICA